MSGSRKRVIRVFASALLSLCVLCWPLHLAQAQTAGLRTVKELAAEAREFRFSSVTGREENPENRMAHNIYSDPDLSGTSGRFSAFSIDFEAEDTAEGTYWALCNWSMDVSALEKKYTVTDAGGAYAGLQDTAYGPKAIMSFWEIHYLDKGKDTILNAHRIYPEGTDDRFGGEGEGTHYLAYYPWEPNHWYRMLLDCYDNESGTTIAEQWIMDLETEEWTLISQFDTGLEGSCFTGSMSQFMENYDPDTCAEFRSFRYKNFFVWEYGASDWKQITGSTLSTDIVWDNKKGNYAFGSDGETFWGITAGYGPDVTKTNEHGPISGYYTISGQ